MKGELLELSKQAISDYLNSISFDSIEVALTTFNLNNYLNKDFTNNKDQIIAALNFISPLGGTNFNSAFLNEPAGIFKVAERAKYNKIVFLITDGNAEADLAKIIKIANENKIKIVPISLTSKIPNVLLELSKSTSDIYYENIDNSDKLKRALLETTYLSSKYNYIQIFWDNYSCDSLRNIKVIVKNKDKILCKDSSSFIVNPKSLPYFDLDFSYFDFGVVPKNSSSTISFNLYARNSNIKIDSIFISNPKFTVFDLSKNDIIPENLNISFKVIYKAQDTLFSTCRIIIYPDYCIPIVIELSAGYKEKSDGSKTLNLTYPNGKEKLVSSTPIEVKWDSKSNQIYNLEFSFNNGINWYNVYKGISGKSIIWNLPDIESDKCLFKILKPSISNLFDKVIYLQYNNQLNNKVSWSNQSDKLVSSTLNGELLIWDVFNTDKARILAKDLVYINALEWSPTTQRIACAFESSLSGYDVILFDGSNNDQPLKLKGNTSKSICVSWSPNGSYITCGNNDGHLNIWDISKPDSTLLSLVNAHIGAIISVAWNPKLDFIASAGSDKWIKFFNSITGTIQNDSLVVSDKVTKLIWTHDGKNLIAASESKNLFVFNIFDNLNQFKPRLKYVINREAMSNQNGIITDVSVSTDENYIILSADNKVSLWDIETGNLFYEYLGHSSLVNSINVSPQNIVASSSYDKTIQIWSLSDIPFIYRILDSDVSDAPFSITKYNVSMNNLEFGSFCVGKEIDSSFTNFISNKSIADIIIDSLVISGLDKSDFSINSNFPITLKAQSTLNVSFNFRPSSEGNKQATISLFSGKNITNSNITAYGIKPVFEITNQFVDFGSVNVEDEIDITTTIIKNNSLNEIKLNNSFFILKSSAFEIIDGSAPITLKPNESLKVKIKFKPNELGRQSEILRYITNENCTPIDINLFGEGSQPKLSLIDTLLFDSLLCENSKELNCIIKNNGQSRVILDTILIDGFDKNNFSFVSNLSNNILEPKSENTIKVKFNSNGVSKKYEANIKITTLKPKLEFSSNLSAVKDSVSSYILNSLIEMRNIDFDTKSSSTFGIKNTTKFNFDYSIQTSNSYFKLLTPNKISLKPNEKHIGQIEFVGYPIDTLITGNIILTDNCNFNSQINLIAEVGNVSTIMTIDTLIDFSKVYCNDSITKKIKITNSGNYPLLLSKEELVKQDDYFSINENINGKLIPKNTSITFSISFRSNISGIFSNQIRINSNSQSKINYINLKAFVPNFNFKFDQDTLVFDNLGENESKEKDIELINSSEDTLSWDLPITIDNYFRIDSIIPKFIPPNTIAKIYIFFKGNSANTSNDSKLVLNTYCNQSAVINLKAITRGELFILFSPQNIFSNSGENVKLKFNIDNPKSLDLKSFKEINTTLKFNSSLLVPTDQKIDTIIDKLSYLKLKIPIEKLIDKSFEISFMSTLGDTSTTKLELLNSTHLGNPLYYIKEQEGNFSLTNVCFEGGGRFITDYGKLSLEQNEPNPTNGLTKFKFNLIEKGETKLEIYNTLGLKVMTLVSSMLMPKSYEINSDLSSLSIGTYIYLLKTPSETLLRKLIILK